MSLFVQLVATFVCFISISVLAAPKTVYDKEAFDLDSLTALSFELNHAAITLVPLDSDRIIVEIEQVLKKGPAERCIHVIKSKRSRKSLHIYNEAQEHFSWGSCSVLRTITVKMGKGSLNRFDLSTAHSQLKAGDIEFDKVELDHRHSQVQVSNIRADSVQISAQHSSISIDTLSGKNVEMTGAHGALNIRTARCDLFDGRWQHGSILLDNSISDDFSFSVSHGVLTLVEHLSEDLRIKSAHGKVSLNAKVTKAKIKNKHGAINFSGSVSSLVTKNQHGPTHITLMQDELFMIDSSASHGPISIHLPKGSAYNYEMLGSNIRVNNKKVQGLGYEKNNQSDNNIRLNTSHGSAQVISF